MPSYYLTTPIGFLKIILNFNIKKIIYHQTISNPKLDPLKSSLPLSYPSQLMACPVAQVKYPNPGIIPNVPLSIKPHPIC